MKEKFLGNKIIRKTAATTLAGSLVFGAISCRGSEQVQPQTKSETVTAAVSPTQPKVKFDRHDYSLEKMGKNYIVEYNKRGNNHDWGFMQGMRELNSKCDITDLTPIPDVNVGTRVLYVRVKDNSCLK